MRILGVLLLSDWLSVQNAWADETCIRVELSDYDYIGCLESGLINVQKGDKWGFVDKKTT